MKKFLAAFIILAAFPAVFAQTRGLEFITLPEGAINRVDTIIDAKIENWGYDKVFLALPSGWQIDEFEQGVSSYAVRETGIWLVYGEYFDLAPSRLEEKVYDSKGFQTKFYHEIGGRTGWYLKPNEGVIIHAKINQISTSGGSINVLKIEKENPGIKVIKWKQRFLLNISSNGFITAPWTVDGATLIESSPAAYSDLSKKGARIYYEDFEIAHTGPKWNEWFDFKNSLTSLLSSRHLAETNLQFFPVVKTKVAKPVFIAENYKKIMYGYLWERDTITQGAELSRNDFRNIPDWFKWFR